ncbi:hypothetical protein [Xenorhabdus sp. BG5]|uniref:hypothetical protein n=1 Tax=Xenorhabdus sp. BG5 TaxID=2782014 RepID=UPI0018808A6F|nr:hypothetical protein [Xenorhabdus sp. BG5]MBE8597932.1 hypothetical protein [Xenorhabdus sp. BG5]
MAPDLNDSYTKNLSIKPYSIREEVIEKFYHLSMGGDLLEVIEYLLIGGDCHNYIEIIRLGCSTEEYYKECAFEMRDSGHNDSEIINYLLALDMRNTDDDDLIGRIAYSDFDFYENGIKKTGKQIKGAFISPEYHMAGLGRALYKSLVLKHEHLICDNIQSIAGGSLWASGMIKLADVRVYDTVKREFIDRLDKGGVGVGGIKPWSATRLPMRELSRWEPNSISHDSCHHIVNIISKDNLYT